MEIMASKDKVDGVPFRTAYGQKLRVAVATGDGLTEQHHKDETDINNIVRKYNKTGLIDHLNQFEKQYGDMTGYDYQDAMNTVAAANSMFAGLPSEIRNRFDNDPAKFINFVDDEANGSELIKMGLAKPIDNPVVDEDAQASVEAESSVGSSAETEAKQG
jgi:phage internal scaffolding protein